MKNITIYRFISERRFASRSRWRTTTRHRRRRLVDFHKFCRLLLGPDNALVCFALQPFLVRPIRSVHLDNTSDYNDNEQCCQCDEHDLGFLFLLRRSNVLRLEGNALRFVFHPRLFIGLVRTGERVGKRVR